MVEGKKFFEGHFDFAGRKTRPLVFSLEHGTVVSSSFMSSKKHETVAPAISADTTVTVQIITSAVSPEIRALNYLHHLPALQQPSF